MCEHESGEAIPGKMRRASPISDHTTLACGRGLGGTEAEGPGCPVLPPPPPPTPPALTPRGTTEARQCFLPGGVRDILASREAPEGTDRPTSAGSSVLNSAADPPRVTHVPPRHGTCWAGSSKLISHRRELWGPQGCCPSARTSMVSSRPCQVPAHPSFHWTVSTMLRKRFCWAPLPNQDRKVITAGQRSLSL